MKIGIIAAMEEELKLLLAELNHKREEICLERPYYSGKLGKHQVVLVQSGVGKVMSAMSVAVLVNHFKVDALINTGSAGALAPDLAIGDVVVANRLAYHDVDLTAFGYEFGRMSGQPLYFKSDQTFVTAFEKVLAKHHVRSKIGLITTSDSFMAGKEKRILLRNIFQKCRQLKWKAQRLPKQLMQPSALLSLFEQSVIQQLMMPILLLKNLLLRLVKNRLSCS
ncbi:MTA/SAH nucleosidase [Streptococcus troglodytae]|uniref:adenosylhomocysteine nucleosidase n=1 Tax=Streptococcus troglodytae TaxID=1111760 RepID=A0A1L7LI06_9STRE|nr:MTA/SAH nucleosidase [Streptococcus troglodytae]